MSARAAKGRKVSSASIDFSNKDSIPQEIVDEIEKFAQINVYVLKKGDNLDTVASKVTANVRKLTASHALRDVKAAQIKLYLLSRFQQRYSDLFSATAPLPAKDHEDMPRSVRLARKSDAAEIPKTAGEGSKRTGRFQVSEIADTDEPLSLLPPPSKYSHAEKPAAAECARVEGGWHEVPQENPANLAAVREIIHIDLRSELVKKMNEMDEAYPKLDERMIKSLNWLAYDCKQQCDALFDEDIRNELENVRWRLWSVRIGMSTFYSIAERIKVSLTDESPSLVNPDSETSRTKKPSKKLRRLARQDEDMNITSYIQLRLKREYWMLTIEEVAHNTPVPSTPDATPKRRSTSSVTEIFQQYFATPTHNTAADLLSPAAGGRPAGAAKADDEVDDESSEDDAKVWAEKYADKMQFRARKWLTPKWNKDPDFTGKRFQKLCVQKLCGRVSFTEHEMDRIIQVIALYGDMPKFRHHTMFIAPAGSDGARDMYLKGVRNHTGEGISVGYLKVTVNQHMHIVSADRNRHFLTSEWELPDGFRPYYPLHPYKNFGGETLPGRKHIPIDPNLFLGNWFAPYFYASF